jgi:hypothetical protein
MHDIDTAAPDDSAHDTASPERITSTTSGIPRRPLKEISNVRATSAACWTWSRISTNEATMYEGRHVGLLTIVLCQEW